MKETHFKHLGVGRYGEKILITPVGTWYWCHTLMDITFVLNGTRRSFANRYLLRRQNNMRGAIRAASRIMLTWGLVEEDDHARHADSNERGNGQG